MAPLSPAAAVLLAFSFGLFAGYLDVAIIVLKKLCWNPEGYYRIARDFPWSVPASHAALLTIAGVAVAVVGRLRPGLVSVRAGSWLLATLALWGALLRSPLYGLCSLVLAAGIGRLIAGAVAGRGLRSRRMVLVPLALVGVLGVLAAATSGRQALREYRAVRGLPPTPRARNVLLIVWDTVRASSLSLYGYSRETTPNVARLATKGVKYQFALSAAPWTYPSHTSFFTGQWPWKIDSQWNYRLDAPVPTLAEYLASRGYQTAGFAANTNCCTYETGLDRGFAHYEDYSQSPRCLLARTIPGQWLLTRILELGGRYVDEMWVGLQSRDAGEINAAFLDWLGRRRPDRPFFAFLNLFDAHDPYIPQPGYAGRFGISPTTRRDYRVLMDFAGLLKDKIPFRHIVMARDCYDDCVAYLDEQLGRLLDELERRGVLADTDVIITSDHGEAFAEHGTVGHSYNVFLEEIRVPLVILSPDAPADREVFRPVSLRDLPATVVERVGLAADSPFPGRSFVGDWGSPTGRVPEVAAPVLSEQVERSIRGASRPQGWPEGEPPRFQLSIVSSNYHYIRTGIGGEGLFDLMKDPNERYNLMVFGDGGDKVEAFRRMLLKSLTENVGSVEVERAYLEEYRRSLEALVRAAPARRVAVDTRTAVEDVGRSRRPGS
jgi:arylsulfatase A-like enzyme